VPTRFARPRPATDGMTTPRLLALTTLALVAFAGNSLLCRLALQETAIDPASFTTLRLASGAAVLAWLARDRPASGGGGDGWSAAALFAYAAGFSFAYVSLTAATGALLLFGAVQVTMVGHGLWSGERLAWSQWVGLAAAFAGLVVLMLPGVQAPPLSGALLMLGAGVAWGIYSLRGRGGGDPLRVTSGNFLRATPLAVVLGLVFWNRATVDAAGIGYALASGAITSGIGYALWYTALPSLRATTAASVQLSVPVLAAFGGILLLGETFTLRMLLASAAVLGGIGLVMVGKRRGRG
jgi:drug/metabolite transporter (DMT)-like permease